MIALVINYLLNIFEDTELFRLQLLLDVARLVQTNRSKGTSDDIFM